MIVGALVPSVVSGQLVPHGPEFQVNSYTLASGTQPPEGIAFDADGRFVVAWSSSGSPGDDDSATSIQGRRFDAVGGALGPQFQVNSLTSGFQSSPTVVTLEDGGFLVV